MKFYSSIFAHGRDFDVDAFIAATALPISHVWRVRDLPTYRSSGVEIDLAQGRVLEPPDQDAVAFEFIEANLAALGHLQQFPGVETFILGISWPIEITEDLAGFCVSFSPRLLALAARVGIEPTAYVELRREER